MVIEAVLPFLQCPVCAGPLEAVGRGGDRPGTAGARCPTGHRFDAERSGYLNLRTGRVRAVTGDTAAMVRARVSFLGRGHYEVLTDALTRVVADALTEQPGRIVLEVGAGTGHHLAGVVDAVPGTVGLAVDVSKPALRRAARVHPRVGAVAFDVAGSWPVPDASVGLLLDVFAPRNVAEMRRVLRPDGVLVVVTPGPGHLTELREPLAMVGTDPSKRSRLDEAFSGRFARVSAREVRRTLRLTVDEVVDLAMMGPTGHHAEAGHLRRRATALIASGTEDMARAGVMFVTASFVLDSYSPSA